MLAHFFFITDPPVYELGTTRTLLQVGPEPARFPEQAARPLQIDESGAVGPLEFTALLVSQRRQCGEVRVPELDAGVRVIRLRREGGGITYVMPPPGPVAPIVVDGACVDRVEVGIPGR